MKARYRALALTCAVGLVVLYTILLPQMSKPPQLGPGSIDPLLALLFATPTLLALGIGFTIAGHSRGQRAATSEIALAVFYVGFVAGVVLLIPAALTRLSMHNYW